MSVRALTITPAGDLRRVDLTENGRSTLRGLYAEIGCTSVDVIRLGDGVDLWVDDEGLLTAEPEANLYASVLVHMLGGPQSQVVFGTGVLALTDDEGETVSLPTAVLEKAEKIAAVMARAEQVGI